jgi:hypothetical protein
MNVLLEGSNQEIGRMNHALHVVLLSWPLFFICVLQGAVGDQGAEGRRGATGDAVSIYQFPSIFSVVQ